MASQIAISPKVKRKSISIEKSAYRFAIGVTFFSMLYLIVAQATGSAWLSFADSGSEPSQITLALIECALGLVVIHAPSLFAKLFHIKLPDVMCTIFYVFIVCAIPLGEAFSFYYRFSVWDSLLHFSSGIMLCMLGSLVFVNFLRKKNCESLIAPAFIGIGSLLFAVSLGVMWEFYEFTLDTLFGTNMQKYLLEDGTALIGKAALLDTMKDLIVGFLGALIAAFGVSASLRNKSGWLYAFGVNKEPESAAELPAAENVLSKSA